MGEHVLHGRAECARLAAHGGNASGPDETHGQRLKAPEHDGLAEPWALREQAHLREPLEQHLNNDPAFQARERSAETMVDAASE